MNLYFISGLGADRRVFRKLTVPPSFKVNHIDWIPVAAEEGLGDYCQKLAKQVDQREPFTLIGLSFGGIIAIEMAKLIRPVQTIIISSISRPEEAGQVYVTLGKLKLQRIIPLRFLLKPSRFLFQAFGAHTEEEKILLRQILADTDPDFFRWSLNRMFSWENEWIPERMLHIHGTKDRILPFQESMRAIPVEGGEHLMVFSRSAEISGLLEKHLVSET
jgi:pimeloyl-ACP methyl ester carboxylesterase